MLISFGCQFSGIEIFSFGDPCWSVKRSDIFSGSFDHDVIKVKQTFNIDRSSLPSRNYRGRHSSLSCRPRNYYPWLERSLSWLLLGNPLILKLLAYHHIIINTIWVAWIEHPLTSPVIIFHFLVNWSLWIDFLHSIPPVDIVKFIPFSFSWP